MLHRNTGDGWNETQKWQPSATSQNKHFSQFFTFPFAEVPAAVRPTGLE